MHSWLSSCSLPAAVSVFFLLFFCLPSFSPSAFFHLLPTAPTAHLSQPPTPTSSLSSSFPSKDDLLCLISFSLISLLYIMPYFFFSLSAALFFQFSHSVPTLFSFGLTFFLISFSPHCFPHVPLSYFFLLFSIFISLPCASLSVFVPTSSLPTF